jgi:hypothetical protein
MARGSLFNGKKRTGAYGTPVIGFSGYALVGFDLDFR